MEEKIKEPKKLGLNFSQFYVEYKDATDVEGDRLNYNNRRCVIISDNPSGEFYIVRLYTNDASDFVYEMEETLSEKLQKRISKRLDELPEMPDNPLFDKLRKQMQDPNSELMKLMEGFAKSLMNSNENKN